MQRSPTGSFPGFTTKELVARLKADDLPEATANKMALEVLRRARVAEGDVSVMTPGERLRFAKAKKGK